MVEGKQRLLGGDQRKFEIPERERDRNGNVPLIARHGQRSGVGSGRARRSATGDKEIHPDGLVLAGGKIERDRLQSRSVSGERCSSFGIAERYQRVGIGAWRQGAVRPGWTPVDAAGGEGHVVLPVQVVV